MQRQEFNREISPPMAKLRLDDLSPSGRLAACGTVIFAHAQCHRRQAPRAAQQRLPLPPRRAHRLAMPEYNVAADTSPPSNSESLSNKDRAILEEASGVAVAKSVEHYAAQRV